MKEYASDKVSVILGGVPITGFMDGSKITVARTVESAALHVGADGEGTKVVNADKSGTVVIRLGQSSLSNSILSTFEATNANFPVIVKDTNGLSLHSGAKAFVSKTPDSEYAQEFSAREWTITVAKLIHFEGGSADA